MEERVCTNMLSMNLTLHLLLCGTSQTIQGTICYCFLVGERAVLMFLLLPQLWACYLPADTPALRMTSPSAAALLRPPPLSPIASPWPEVKFKVDKCNHITIHNKVLRMQIGVRVY